MRSARVFLLAALAAGTGAGCGLLLGLDEFVDAPAGQGGGGGTAGAGGAGGTPVCVPGTTEPCYSGPPGTEGIGACMGGERACSEDGTGYGVCLGEVIPAAENCAVLGDEDCDGTGCSDPLWVKVLGDADSQDALAVAVDGSGNVIVAGRMEGSTDCGGAPLVSGGGLDAFVAKLDAAGQYLWSKRFGDVNDQSAWSLAVDGDGNVLLAGYYQGSIDLGGGNLTSTGLNDIFVAKLDPDGAHLWSRSFGNNKDNSAVRVAVGPNGDVVIACHSEGAIDFGNGSLTSAGFEDIFLAKLSAATGSAIWSKRFGDSDPQLLDRLAIDSAGGIYLAGRFYGTLTFDGFNLLASATPRDLYLAKLDALGTFAWAKMFAASGGGILNGETIGDLAVAPDGHVLVTGIFSGTMSFGTTTLVGPDTSWDTFLSKLTAAGSYAWTKQIVASAVYMEPHLAVDSEGNIAIVADFKNTIDFGGGGTVSNGPGRAIAKLDGSGGWIWSKRLGTGVGPKIYGMAADRTTGQVVLVGLHVGTEDYGLGPQSSAGGSYDIFLAKFAP